ncbi:BTB/POZ domain-containing protein [Acorus gramineus]|uniref:BTB/POZ domain-containing protein n=1 Tax=Acorus gramineus TaxID=55184 RepID=A0AAV9ACY1_ACOGR|nr:BTB/POZ domain-containing protein [Acorus gramineus]
MAVRGHDRVRFSVGGRIFETITTTLANTGLDSILGAMLDDNGEADHFIDRNPDCFFVLLDLLCKGELHPSPSPWGGSLQRGRLLRPPRPRPCCKVRTFRWKPPPPRRLQLRPRAARMATAPPSAPPPMTPGLCIVSSSFREDCFRGEREG